MHYALTEFHETHQIRTLCPDPDTLKFGANAPRIDGCRLCNTSTNNLTIAIHTKKFKNCGRSSGQSSAAPGERVCSARSSGTSSVSAMPSRSIRSCTTFCAADPHSFQPRWSEYQYDGAKYKNEEPNPKISKREAKKFKMSVPFFQNHDPNLITWAPIFETRVRNLKDSICHPQKEPCHFMLFLYMKS